MQQVIATKEKLSSHLIELMRQHYERIKNIFERSTSSLEMEELEKTFSTPKTTKKLDTREGNRDFKQGIASKDIHKGNRDFKQGIASRDTREGNGNSKQGIASGDITNEFDNIFHMYEQSVTYDNRIRQMYQVLHKYDKEMDYTLSDVSQTYMTETGELFEKISIKYKHYEKITSELNAKVLDTTSKNLVTILEADIKKIPNMLEGILQKYPEAIELYVNVIQKAIDYLWSIKEKSMAYNLINQVEEDKTWLLQYQCGNVCAKSATKSIVRFKFRTFGLIPNTPMMPLDQIYLFEGSKSQDFAKLAKKVGTIIVLNRITDNPIEFNIWNLIDWFVAKNEGYTSSGMGGINRKLIKRFMNIIPFSVEGKHVKNKFSLQYCIYGDITPDVDYYILETYNEKDYRCLVPWFTLGDKRSCKLTYPYIKEFLDYLQKPDSYVSRLSNYNRIIERSILEGSNMFFKHKISSDTLATISEHTIITDISKTRMDILNILQHTVDDIVKKEYKNYGNLDKNKIGEILHHKDLLEAFGDATVKQYYIYKKLFTVVEPKGEFSRGETLSTYLSQLDLIIRQFGRYLNDLFRKEPPKVDSDSEVLKKLEIEQYISDLLKRAIEDSISDNKNIYQNVMFKDNLLNLD